MFFLQFQYHATGLLEKEKAFRKKKKMFQDEMARKEEYKKNLVSLLRTIEDDKKRYGIEKKKMSEDMVVMTLEMDVLAKGIEIAIA